MTEVTECRGANNTPWEIKDWLEFPYKFFSRHIGVYTGETLLDIACGENYQLPILKSMWDNVTSADYEDRGPGILQVDITKMPEEWVEKPFDYIFSFETIEHVDRQHHLKIVADLLHRAKRAVVIGSVNRTGPTYLGPHEIWKDGKNEFHVAEMSWQEWLGFFSAFEQLAAAGFADLKVEYYHSVYRDGGQWEMRKGLSADGISNYALLRKS